MPDQDSTKGRSVLLPGGKASSEQKIIEERIGYIGLGRMGIAMASNLAQSSCKVISLVRHPERIKQGYVAAPVFGNPDAAKGRQLLS
jgi:lactate dehydrogenase-like 2-hydroxyacid dehydrogenase